MKQMLIREIQENHYFINPIIAKLNCISVDIVGSFDYLIN